MPLIPPSWLLIFHRSFQNPIKDEIVNLLKINIRYKHNKLKEGEICLLAWLVDNFCYADFHYLKMKIELIFMHFTDDLLEKIMVSFIMEEVISLKNLRFFSIQNHQQNTLLH